MKSLICALSVFIFSEYVFAGSMKAFVSVRKNTCSASSCQSVEWNLPEKEKYIEIDPWSASKDEIVREGEIDGERYTLSTKIADLFDLNKSPYSAYRLILNKDGINILDVDIKMHSGPAFNYSAIKTQRISLPDGRYTYLTLTFWESK